MKLPHTYTMFFLRPILLGLASFFLYWYGIAPYLPQDLKTHETLIGTYVTNVFVGWIFFSAFLLMRADEEWKKTDAAVRSRNFEKFKIEAPKKVAASVLVTHLITGIMAVTAFYLFYYEHFSLAFVILFGTSFLVSITTLTLWDLDDPLDGLIQVKHVPKEWMKRIEK